MVTAHGGSPASSFFQCSLLSDTLGLPSRAYIDIPRSREWEAAVCRDRTLFKTRPKDVLLRLSNRMLYIGPHVQDYLVGVESEWDEHLPRWVLAVQNELRTDAGLPPFPARPRATRG